MNKLKERSRIALITDLDVNEGIGKYGQYLYEFLKDKFPADYLYLDYKQRGLVRNPGNERKLIAKTNSYPFDNKPFFWKRIKRKIPSYDFYHLVRCAAPRDAAAADRNGRRRFRNIGT